ncbi:MAG TPA: NAD-glutamate dehydrogenase, partial [Actinomycetes bacterium]
MRDRLADRTSALEHAKDQLIARAAADPSAVAAWPGGAVEGLAAFLRRYYRHVAPEDLVGRRVEQILAAAMAHRDLAVSRPQGTASVRVRTPEGEGHSVVEVVCDDMPFLVDSVTAELSRHGRAIHLVIHPQLVVRRDVTGRLLDICDASTAADAGPDCADAVVESWMHVDIDRETDSDERTALVADLERVLRDVREAVEDWPKMQSIALRLADEITDAPPAGLPAQEVTEACDLLRWLADAHFTFLGYRENALAAGE